MIMDIVGFEDRPNFTCSLIDLKYPRNGRVDVSTEMKAMVLSQRARQ
jgi:hypothetical protein